MRVIGLTAVILLALAALAAPPGAGAVGGVTGQPLCGFNLACVPTIVCLDGVYCQGSPCDPATECTVRTHADDQCRYNATIDGETCVTRIGLGADAGGRAIPLPGVYAIPGASIPPQSVEVPESTVELQVDLTRGFVHDENLPNDWISHALRLRLAVADVDMGETTLGVYQSTIDTTGGDDEMHTFTHGAFSVRHEGPAGRTTASGGLVLLDGSIEACELRVGDGAEPTLTCTNFFPSGEP